MTARRAVWKFPLGVDDEQWVPMPLGAQPVHVHAQGDVPCLWAVVDPDAPRVVTHGTGHVYDDTGLTYVGSYHILRGSFVGHVWCEAV